MYQIISYYRLKTAVRLYDPLPGTVDIITLEWNSTSHERIVSFKPLAINILNVWSRESTTDIAAALTHVTSLQVIISCVTVADAVKILATAMFNKMGNY